jgi:hypothetical protein
MVGYRRFGEPCCLHIRGSSPTTPRLLPWSSKRTCFFLFQGRSYVRVMYDTNYPCLRFWRSGQQRAGWSEVRVPAGAGNFSLHYRVQTGSGAHSASYRVGTRGSFPGSKVAGAWSWPLTSIQYRGQEYVELYLHSHNTSPWRVAQIKAQGRLYLYLYTRHCL